ncbi:MAG: hypothetical protein ACI4D2_03760 [Lachnospiraceae bacterium]
MLKTRGLLIVTLLSFVLLTGCGEKKELTEFKDNMTLFYDQITDIGDSMKEISPDSEDAVNSLLTLLDAMEVQFQFLADIQVPTEFSTIETLADEAAMHMTEAVNYYHQAHEGEIFDENLASVASQHYGIAMKRINYIATLLQGEIPDDPNVIVTEDNGQEFEPYSAEDETFQE